MSTPGLIALLFKHKPVSHGRMKSGLKSARKRRILNAHVRKILTFAHVRILAGLASCYCVQGKWEQAEKEWGQASELDPEMPLYWHYRGLAAQKMGDLPKVRICARNWPRISCANAHVRTNCPVAPPRAGGMPARARARACARAFFSMADTRRWF